MRILIANQHTSNHGDESALKGLIARLKTEKVSEIGLLYNSAHQLTDAELIDVTTAGVPVTHHNFRSLSSFEKVLIRLYFCLPFWLFEFIASFTLLGSEMKVVSNYDLIINSPGGVNIGPYMDWRYLWRLDIAKRLGKKVSVFAISIGPFPKDLLFTYSAKRLLKSVDFLSLRDKKSQFYASQNGIKFMPTIDSAFLDMTFDVALPEEISISLNSNYVVIVPNELYRWHPHFQRADPKRLDSLFLSLIDHFVSKNIQVVLLPQLFGPVNNDKAYFEALKGRCENPNGVVVISETYDSDVQQSIVRGADFLVGARYHSIVFAIRNSIPFLALSYEHKMSEMLELLGLREHSLDIHELLDEKHSLIGCVERLYGQRNQTSQIIRRSVSNATEMAVSGFEAFRSKSLIPMAGPKSYA